MRLLLAELRKVWGRRVTALCLAVPASAWREVGRDLRGLSTAEQQTLINE